MNARIAHTAEHAFIGSLQHLLGETLRVRKVEHGPTKNTAFIVIPHLDLDTVAKAEVSVNSLISHGKRVFTRVFDSLEEARREVPGLRANEERISGRVRVVDIEGCDTAACAMDHANDLKDCAFFLVTRLSKSGQEYEVDFAVGLEAKMIAISLSASLLRVCNELGANINTIENTARKLRAEHEQNRRRLMALGREKLESVKPENIAKVALYKGIFSNLLAEQLVEFAGEKIASSNAVIILANIDHQTATLVLARNEELAQIDCHALFRSVAGPDGRGGGKPHFVTGVVNIKAVKRVVDAISSEIIGLLGAK